MPDVVLFAAKLQPIAWGIAVSTAIQLQLEQCNVVVRILIKLGVVMTNGRRRVARLAFWAGSRCRMQPYVSISCERSGDSRVCRL